MIHIRIATKNSRCIQVVSKGHAEYAEEGQDIICAAVSVLMVNTANSIETLTEDGFTCEEDDGYVAIAIEEEASEGAHLLDGVLTTRSLESIRETYGDAYLDIVTKEV